MIAFLVCLVLFIILWIVASGLIVGTFAVMALCALVAYLGGG